ncbi:MAG: ribosome maturation factor RimM [Candidatus Thermochlorobacter sp.]
MELFIVGRIVKPHGVRGEVKVQIETSFPEKFKSRKRLYIGKSAKDAKPIEVAHARLIQNTVLLKFKGVETPEEAEKLRNQVLFVDETQLVKLGKDKAYIHELVGLIAYDTNGKRIGTLNDVLNLPSCDAYEIQCGNKSVLVPALDEFIEEVNLTEKRVVLKRFEEFL